MGQKVNPILLRLQSSNRHFDNFWYSNYFYAELLSKDLFVTQYLNTFFKLLKLPSTRLSIQHTQKRTKIYTFFCYPKQSRELRSKFFQILSTKRNENKKHKELNKFLTKNCLNNSVLWSNYKNEKKLTYFDSQSLLSIYFSKKKNLLLYSATISKNSITFGLQNKILEKNLFFKKKRFQQQNANNLKKLTINLLFNKLKESSNEDFFTLYNKNLIIKKQQFLKYFIFLYTTLIKYNKKTSVLTNYSKLTYPIRSFQYFFPKYYFSNFDEKKRSSSNKKQNSIFNGEIFFKKEKNNVILNPFFQNSWNNSLYNKSRIKQKSFTQSVDFQNSIIFERDSVQLKSDILGVSKMKFWNNSSFLLPISNISNILEKELKYKNYIENFLSSKYKVNFDYIPFKINQDWQHAGFLADEIVYFLERRVPFRRIKTRILKQISENSVIRGVRITCSGRVGGKSKKAQRAKIECVKYGQTSLHVFSSQIDYAVRTAHTIFGSVGIKVWICYN